MGAEPKTTDKPESLRELEERLREVYDLRHAAWVLQWDQWTLMPGGGVEGRARQLALVRRLAHEKFTNSRIGELLDELQPIEVTYPYESYEASLVRMTRSEYERETRKPLEFVQRFAEHSGISYAAWLRAKEEDNFEVARPHLERRLELSRELSSFYSGAEHLVDPLLRMSDPGIDSQSIQALFSELRSGLLPLVRAISEEPAPNDSFLGRRFPRRARAAFSEEMLRRLGYDFFRGRYDAAESPFMSKLSSGDIRIVTWDHDDFTHSLFATLHEAGHALYEQGIPVNLDGTPLGEGNSVSLHESQSRLFENIIGRGLPFWEFFYPKLRRSFPEELGGVSLNDFFRAVNRVQPSLIRTRADEVTYNLHVVMRFDFELALLEGSLTVRDLPGAWWERSREDLGLAPKGDREGCLQDPHWYDEVVGGMFHGYALGNLLAAQFYEAAIRECPEIPKEMAAGEFGSLTGWLSENVWSLGGGFTAEEVAKRTTGSSIAVEFFLSYLRSKYGEIYDVRL